MRTTTFRPQAWNTIGLVIPFCILFFVTALADPHFVSVHNILQVLRQASILGVIAVGVTFVVLCGRLDLSVGSMLSLTTVVAISLTNSIGATLAILLTLLLGVLCGALNGFLIGVLRLNSLIVTLGMLSFLQGLALLYTGGVNVNLNNPDATWFPTIGQSFFLGVPLPVYVFGSVAIILGFILRKTPYGDWTYALGGNERASRYSGVRISPMLLSAYILSGLCTAVAALVLGARVMGAQDNVGQGYELQALAAIILGGTSLLGGKGGITQTVLGILLLSFLQNSLLLLGLSYYVQWLITWAVIIGAVWLDIASRRRSVFV